MSAAWVQVVLRVRGPTTLSPCKLCLESVRRKWSPHKPLLLLLSCARLSGRQPRVPLCEDQFGGSLPFVVFRLVALPFPLPRRRPLSFPLGSFPRPSGHEQRTPKKTSPSGARTCPKKKRHETREQPSGLETIVRACTYKEPILQRTKLGKHGGRAIELIKYYRATLISDATSSDSRSRLAFGGSETYSRLSLHLFRNLCGKALNLPAASASSRRCCHYLLRGPIWLASCFFHVTDMGPSVAKMVRDLGEQWEVPARFDPSKHFVRLLAVDCRPEHVHHFHHPLTLGRSLR